MELNLKYVGFGKLLLSRPHVSARQCTISIHSKDFSHFPRFVIFFTLHHSSFPTVIPVSCFYKFILNSVSDASPFHFPFFLPLSLPRWQLSLKILHLWQECFFWFCSFWLGPTERSAIQCDAPQKEQAELVLYFTSSLLPLLRFSVIFCL